MIGLVLATAVGGCRPQAAQQRYELQGTVVSVDVAAGRATIDHQEIPGFMGAMTMPFVVRDEEGLGQLEAGDRVRATLVVESDRSWIAKILSIDSLGLRDEDEAPKASFRLPQPGDAVPDFTLVNQDGNPIHLHQYRGHPLLLTFVYTRCPLPDYCPLMNDHLSTIRSAIQNDPSIIANTHLLTISFDPEFDTPEVLRRYGVLWTQSSGPTAFDDWEFATGTSEEVKAITAFFGLGYWQEKEEIIHTLRTALIAPDGKLFKLYKGNDWTPQDVLRDLKSLKLED